MKRRILVVGATGFVGARLVPALAAAGDEVISASRKPPASPIGAWRRVDVDDPDTLLPALEGVEVACYLVHGMGGGEGYADREARAAEAFASAAAARGLSRIVYLGGPRPSGATSRHLESRLRTGEILRGGPVPVVELQAGMIVGPGSEGFRIIRDLGVRLPVMVLPTWLASRSQPVAVDDVIVALVAACRLEGIEGAWGLPGPETLSARDMLWRVAALRGTRPLAVSVPLLSPRLSAVWIELVTRAHGPVARELVEGLRSDILCPDEGFWRFLPEHTRIGFDAAAARALKGEDASLPLSTLVLERLLRVFSRRAR